MNALESVHRLWRKTLSAIQLETPDKALNLVSNGWLLYQTIACRLWARSGFISQVALMVSGINCRMFWLSFIPMPGWPRTDNTFCIAAV